MRSCPIPASGRTGGRVGMPVARVREREPMAPALTAPQSLPSIG